MLNVKQIRAMPQWDREKAMTIQTAPWGGRIHPQPPVTGGVCWDVCEDAQLSCWKGQVIHLCILPPAFV